MSLPSKLPESNRAEVKSKTPLDMPTKAPQAAPIEEETPGLKHARNRQAEERIEDEPSVSSGSETDREDDGNHNDEVIPRFPSQGFFLLPFVSSCLNENGLSYYFISVLYKRCPSFCFSFTGNLSYCPL